jgi:hypothetical protein
VPAKLRRELTDEEVAHVRRGVQVYLGLKARYLAAADSRNGVSSASEPRL